MPPLRHASKAEVLGLMQHIEGLFGGAGRKSDYSFDASDFSWNVDVSVMSNDVFTVKSVVINGKKLTFTVAEGSRAPSSFRKDWPSIWTYDPNTKLYSTSFTVSPGLTPESAQAKTTTMSPDTYQTIKVFGG
jgi:hypothetical protein